MFKGAITAIVTPFKNGKVDYESFYRLIEYQIKNGIHGIVPCGTTGESATLSHEEHKEVVKKAIEYAEEIAKKEGKEKPKIIAGAGSNSTEEAIGLVKHAESVGADGVLVITPYYNKPTQEGLIAHFKKVSENTSLPIVMYNVPGRTGVNLLPDTIKKLMDIENIVAVKEASGNLQQIAEIVKIAGDKVRVISGDDIQLHPIIAVGGVGVISVAANIVPEIMVKYFELIWDNNWEEARKLYLEKIFPISKALFIETNPIPVKQALEFMNLVSSEVRLPLVRMKEENKLKLREILKETGVI